MAANLRRAAAPLGAAAGSVAAAAASSLERWGAAGGAGESLLRAAATGLRHLHDAAGARLQGEEALTGAGAPHGYASAQPAESEAPGAGRGSGISSSGGSRRPKPRFLLERLALGDRPHMGAGRGGGGQSTGQQLNGRAGPGAPGSGTPGQRAQGSGAPGSRPQQERGSGAPGSRPQQGRDGRLQQQGSDGRPQQQRGPQQERGPGQQQQGRDGRPQPPRGNRPQQQRGPGQQQQGRDGRPQPLRGDRPQQQRGPGQVQAPAWLQREREQQPREGSRPPPPAQGPRGARPPPGADVNGRRQDGAPPPRAQQAEWPPYQTVFDVPTEFPTAFPRAQQPPSSSGGASKKSKKKHGAQQPKVEDAPEEVTIPEDVTVLRLAQLLGAPIEKVEAVLAELGEDVASRHDLVSPDSAELAALEFGKIAVLASRGGRGVLLDADAVPRPAVVTVMGHVDHGKTTLLDALRSTSVAAGEAGGITQHIGAFEVSMPGSHTSLTFLDTPGHAAFTSMRARGAAVTDLVVLVVAADDGIMPQTREAISHARAAGCPIVVAITKCDTERANPKRVRQQLIATGLELEEVGGNIQVVEVAATTGLGLDELEEALLLQAEMMELQASRSRRAEAVVIEARVDRGQGPVATVVVKRGTLKVGQPMVVGTEWGRVRSLKGTGGKTIDEVLPGQPAEIAGLKGLPQAGDQLLVVDSEERAQVISRARTSNAAAHRRASVARMMAEQQAREAGAAAAAGPDGATSGEPAQRTLPLIIKADVQGSAEAVRDAVAHLCTEYVKVQVVHVGVGPVSHSDVQLAVPLGAKILGFNVRTAGGDVEQEANMHNVEVRCQRVIYGLLEDVEALLVGASPKVEHEVVAGAAEVLQVFQLKGSRGKDAGMVAGCRVTEGSIKGSLRYRVMRQGEAVHTGPCASLKRHKLEVETVGKGTECGILLEGFDDVRPGDILQCVSTEMRASAQVNAVEENKWLL